MTSPAGAVWFLAVERPGWRAEWDCETLGAPDARDLMPTRRPASGDFSRHIPRRAYSVTIGAAIEMESGLEHDLLRWLDLQANVVWLVGQPVRFHFPLPERRRPVIHTPDLLSQHRDGTVTLWDARPPPRQDDTFLLKAELTAEECRKVGWRHQIFDGLPTPKRMNLLWLNGYRRPMPWHPRWTSELESLLRLRLRTVGEVSARDDGSGELVATMWHLIATGKITCDLSRPIREPSSLSWPDEKPTSGEHEGHQPASAITEGTGIDTLVRTRLGRAGR